MVLKISVVGLGKAGLPLASVIADSGLPVIGIDTDQERCNQINKRINPIPEEPQLDILLVTNGGNTLIATTDYDDAKDCNFYIIVVPLLMDACHNPYFKQLEKACRNIVKNNKEQVFQEDDRYIGIL